MSAIGRYRSSPYFLHTTDLLNYHSPDEQEAHKHQVSVKRQPGPAPRGSKARMGGKASLLDMMLDETGKKRPPSQVKPVKVPPRKRGDKDELRLQDEVTKGIPVRLSSADAAPDDPNNPTVPKPGRGGARYGTSKWFQDGFDDPADKRTT